MRQEEKRKGVESSEEKRIRGVRRGERERNEGPQEERNEQEKRKGKKQRGEEWRKDEGRKVKRKRSQKIVLNILSQTELVVL